MKNFSKKTCIGVLLVLAVLLVFSFAGCEPTPEPVPNGPVQLDYPINIVAVRRLLTWDEVSHATGYVVEFRGTEYETTGCSLDLSFDTGYGDVEIKVKAKGDGTDYSDSEWTTKTITLNQKVQTGSDEAGFEYTLLADGSGYEISLGTASIKGDKGVITIPEYFGDYPVKRIADRMFYIKGASFLTGVGCNNLTTGIILPEQLESIGERAFMALIGIESMTIPNSVKDIGEAAFYGCVNLKTVKLSKNLKTIPDKCFMATGLAQINLPKSVETIGVQAFAASDTLGMSGTESDLKELTIPSNVKNIGNYAFMGREKLETITLSADNLENFGIKVFEGTRWYEKRGDGLVILYGVLLGYKGTVQSGYVLTLPSSVKVIASMGLSVSGIKKVIIPDGVRFAGGERIFGSDLEEVVLPSDLTSIPDKAFYACRRLESISLPSTLTDIGDEAFKSSGLKEIVIPSSVVEIGENPFIGCDNLESIYYDGTSSEWNALVKENNADNADAFASATIYTYSATTPTDNGNYWFYDSNGNPIKW